MASPLSYQTTEQKMNNSYGTIYKITNNIDNKIYVGQTTYTPAEKRWSIHKSIAKNKNTRSYLYNAIRKHGISNFTFEVIITCYSRKQLDFAEDFAIEILQANQREKGYNLMLGLGGRKHSEETKKKMSETRKANPDMMKHRMGKKQSLEERQKRSDTMKRIGHRPPEPTREQRVAWATGREGHWGGKQRTTKRSKPCIVNGFIYPSATRAAELEDIHINTLRSWLSGTRTPKLACEYLN